MANLAGEHYMHAGGLMLNVLLTIDTEVHPIHKDWMADCLRRDMDRDIEGIIDGRRVGLDYELEMLARNGLKATFSQKELVSKTPRCTGA